MPGDSSPSADPAPTPTANGAAGGGAAAPPGRRLARAILSVPTPLIFLVSVAVAALLLWRQGTLHDLRGAARQADPRAVAAAAALYLGGLSLLCLRWHVLARMVGGASDAARAADAFLTSVVVNYAAPIGLAVPTRAALTKRSLGLSTAQSGAVALWEIGLDVLILGTGTALWLATGGVDAVGTPTAPGRAAILAGGAAVTAAVAIAIVANRLVPGWRRAIRDLPDYPGRRPVDAAVALGLTLAYWALQAVILGVLLGAVAADHANPRLVLGLVAPPVLVGMLSPVPGGAGVREALMVAVARAEGVNAAAVLLAAVAYRAALFAAVPVLYAGVRVWLAVRRQAEPDDRGDLRG